MKILFISVLSLLLLQACGGKSNNSNNDDPDLELNTSYREFVRDVFSDDENNLPRLLNELSIVEDADNEDFSDLL